MNEKSKKPLVALIFGGRGHECDVSVAGAEYMLEIIDKERFSVLEIYINRSGEWLAPSKGGAPSDTDRFTEEVIPCTRKNAGGFLLSGEFVTIDCAIPLLHGDYGEDGVVQGTLENSKIRYIGCDTVCSAVCADKAFTKAVAERLGIPVARYITSYGSEDTDSFISRVEEELDYPMFIKPSRLGSSIGASCAISHEQLCEAVRLARALSPHVMVEEKISVECELECAYFGTRDATLFSEIGKIEYPCGFYDYNSKYASHTIARTSANADISESISKRIKRYSRTLANALGIRHLSRFDYFLSKTGDVIFNEVNTFPGFTESSLYPALIERAGIPSTDMVSLWIADAIKDGA